MAVPSALAGDGACVLSSSRPGMCLIDAVPLSTWFHRNSRGTGWKSSWGAPHPPLCASAPRVPQLCHQAVPGPAAQDDARSLPQPSLAMQLLHGANGPQQHMLWGNRGQGCPCECQGHPKLTLAAPQFAGMCFPRKCGSIGAGLHTSLHELHEPNRQTCRSKKEKT